jgi:hypothetical protein
MFVLMPESSAFSPRELEMVETMTGCAHVLGVAAAGIAQAAADDDTAGFLAASAEFRHCFFAVRMGIRLAMSGRAAARAAVAATTMERPERERPEAVDAPERERDEARIEIEREGDYEPVSLPLFLKRLRGVAAQAEARREQLPAHVRDGALPTLQTLLRQATTSPGEGRASAAVVLARPPATPAGRSRLLNSTGGLGLQPLRAAPALRRPSG